MTSSKHYALISCAWYFIVSIRIRTGGLRMMESPRQFLMTSIIMIGMVIVIGYFL